MVIGEPQILGQVKEAYERAEEAGALGSVLAALQPVREARPGAHGPGWEERRFHSSVAVELARRSSASGTASPAQWAPGKMSGGARHVTAGARYRAEAGVSAGEG
jgi:hypothetical protein